jgi:hypothetical protein
MGIYSAAWEDRLSELADYRNINGTAMFLRATKKTLLAMVSKPKGLNIAPGRKEIAMTFPVSRH